MRTKKWIGGFVRKGVYWLDRTQGSQRYRFSLKVLTLRAALAELERFERDPARYVAGQGAGYRLDEAVTDYLKVSATRSTEKHVAGQKKALARWSKALGFYGVHRLDQITPAHAEEFIRWRGEGGYAGREVGASSVNQDLFAMKALLRWARDSERIPETVNPLRKVRQLKVKGNIHPHRPVKHEDILAVRDELKRRAQDKDAQHRAVEHPWADMVILLYSSAMRYDSAVRVEVVEAEGKVRAAQKGKGHVEVSVKPDVIEAAKRVALAKLPRDSGMQMNHRLEVAARKLGLDRFTVHDLRVSAATRLHREGMALVDLQRLLGHANISTTQLYVRADRVLQGVDLGPKAGPTGGT